MIVDTHLSLDVLFKDLITVLVHLVEGVPVLLDAIETFGKEEVLRIGLVFNNLAAHCHKAVEVILISVNFGLELLVVLEQLLSFL